MLWSVASADVDLSSVSERQKFAKGVGQLIHALVEIYNVSKISEEDITSEGFNVSVVENGLSTIR